MKTILLEMRSLLHATAPLLCTLLLSFAAHAQDSGDPEAGAREFRQCSACHSLDEGEQRSGPSLYGLIGSEAGTVDGFRYSSAMAESGITWDEDTLRAFIANPRGTIPGNRMAFSGVRNEQKLNDLIAYLIQETE